MKRWHPVYSLFLAGVMSVSFGQAFATANQQATETAALQTAPRQVPIHPSQETTNQTQTTPVPSSNSELGSSSHSLSSTNAPGLFGGDTCRPAKIEITPCK